VPDIYPGENYAYDDGWKRWRKPWAVVGDQWVEGKNAYVYGKGEWTHIWESTPPVLDLEVQVSHVVNDGIYVNWVEHPYADGYTLVTPNGVTADVSSNSYRDRVPVPSVGKYTVTAYRVGDDGNSEGLLTSESETVSICQVPTSFTAVRNGTRVELQWSDASVGFHDGFTVDAGSPISIPAGTTNYTHTSPTAGAVNSYKVKANIGSLSSAWTSSQSVSIEANVPTNVAIAATTTIGELKLTFGAPSSGSVTGYTVQANNGSWVAASSNNSGATYKFTGSGSKSMRVLAKSAGGNSAYVTKSATPLWTAKPNTPKSVSVAATSTVGQLKLTWSAPSADSTHSAASTYQVQTSTNNSSWTTVSGNKTSPYTHSFGSSGSGVRYMRVRATNTAGSSSYVSKSGTPLWAYPAPAAPSVSKFGPESSFGRMVLTFKTSGANNSQYRVAFKVGSGSWTYGSWTNVGNNTTKAVHVGTAPNTGTGGATQTVYGFVDCKNSTGQSTRSTQANYQVRPSPMVWQAADTGHYRSGKYGQNTDNHNRPYMGYYSNSAYNYDGLWFYGNNAFKNMMTTSGTHKPATYRVPTVWRITMVRNGGGNNSSDPVYVGTTTTGTKPANLTAGAGAHVVYDVVHLGNLKYGESFNADVPASLYNNLITGARQGFGVATGSGKPYMYLYGIQENGFSGWVHVEHIG
jgi:hypothetical protein